METGSTAAMAARWVGSGMLATLTMDLGAALVRKTRLTAGLPPPLIGRWFAGLARGRFSYDTILNASPVRRELPLALVGHYLIGITLTCAFVSLLTTRAGSAEQSRFLLAVGFGVLSNLLPWLVMFPAMGFGVLGLRAPAELLLLRTSFVNHLFFGLGLALSLRWLSPLR